MVVERVVVPEGAIPPGSATVGRSDAPGGGFVHTVRFEMPAQGPAEVRLWFSWEGYSPLMNDDVPVLVTSDQGPQWSTTVTPFSWTAGDDAGFTAGSKLFIGSSEQLSALLAGVQEAGSSPNLARRVQDGLQLSDPDAPPSCRALASAAFVIIDARDSVGPLLLCAARGARVLAITPAPPVDLADLAPGTITRWGRGMIAWAPAFDRSAGAAAIVLSDETLAYGGSPVDTLGWYPNEVAEPSPLGGVGLVVLLVLYVAVIGPVGYLVGVRPRRVGVAWGWFPMVAAVTTLGSVVVALTMRDAPVVRINRVAAIAPDGFGLRSTQVAPDAPYGDAYGLDGPFADGDLSAFWPGNRFGSPFGSPTGPIRIDQDTIAGRARLGGLSTGSYGMPSIGWAEPVGLGGPRIAATIAIGLSAAAFAVLRIARLRD